MLLFAASSIIVKAGKGSLTDPFPAFENVFEEKFGMARRAVTTGAIQ